MQVKVKFTIPTPGTHQLKLSLMSDSYVGVDQDIDFNLDVGEEMEVDADEDEKSD